MSDAWSPDEIVAQIREVTGEEVEFYAEHGWVMIEGLVTPGLAAELLSVADSSLDHHEERGSAGFSLGFKGIEPFRSLVFSEAMARNSQRLIEGTRLKEGIPLRYRSDFVVCKQPGAAGTPYHQDSPEHGSDRVGELQWWLALDEVTADTGAMRFADGSHRAGPLGAVLKDTQDLLEQYPRLVDVYELSPPFHYKPGDATVHDGYTVHGAPPNTSDRSRWSCIFAYTPADMRWWDGKAKNSGSERLPLGDEENPIVYPGQPVPA